MSSKREDRIERPVTVPAQEDEADIVEEVGAEIDENGELRASIEDVRKAGALDVETVRRNRQSDNVAKKKQKGEKVSFSSNDPLVKYEDLLKAWPTSTMHVKLRRLSGGPEVTEMITSFPRSATELYEEIKVKHGQCADASYEVEFFDASSKEWRGRSKITMADTRPGYVQGQPMHHGYQPQQHQPTAPGAPSVVVHTPPGQDMGSMFTTFQSMFDMFQDMQRRMTPHQAPQQQMPMMPPQPPPTASPAEQMAWMQQMFDIFQRMQGPNGASSQNPQAPHLPSTPAPHGYTYRWLPESNCCVLEPINRQAPAANGASQQPQAHPQMQNLPSTPAPRGYVYRWMPESNCCVLEPIGSPPPREPMMRRDFGGPGQGPGGYRPRPYYPQGDPNDGRSNGDPYYPQQQQRREPVDPLRESMSTIRRAMALREELDAMFGERGGQFDRTPPEQDPDSPVHVERTENGDIVYDKEGNIRGWDTLLVNVPGIIKKGGEFVKEISKTAQAERQRREQTQRLPPGYVRMQEGDQPPHGYIAVPIDQVPEERPPPQRSRQRREYVPPQAREQDLPPPPEYVPPPLQEEEPEEQEQEPPQQRGWEDLS